MSSKIISDFVTSEARKKQEQHLHALWPGEADYRAFHRAQLDLAGLTLLALKNAIRENPAQKVILAAVPDQAGNSRAELHLLKHEHWAWFALNYAASRIVRTLGNEQVLVDAIRDYPKHFDMQWYRMRQLKDPRVAMDLMAAEQYADRETHTIWQQCHDWALAQLNSLELDSDAFPTPVHAPEPLKAEVPAPIEPYIPYSQIENHAALLMFGFKPGLKSYNVTLQPELGHYRLMNNPPEPSSVFPRLFLRANSRQDITEISAVTTELVTQPDGTELRQRWDEYRCLLDSVFGSGDVTDFIMNTTKSQQGHWLKHLKQELNELRCSWSKVKNTHPSTGIKSVELWASGISPTTGTLNLRFTLSVR